MKYSLNWLKEHLDESGVRLPDIAIVTKEVTMRAFEVEEVEDHGGDAIMEIKVLPDRAHDALSHRGMAREMGALLGVKRKPREAAPVTIDAGVPTVRVTIEDPKLCMRYIAVRVDGVEIGASPKDIADKLSSVGSRSINNIVDITNFVLFDIGQPLHAFDADKLKGGITIRLAKKGETMSTLDNKALVLGGTELVIADDEAVLALAGIKGGKHAEVTSTTKNIIIESANFDPTLTRKTSQKHNIKTDASKRYENGITSMFAEEACALALSLIATHGGREVKIGMATDVYPTEEAEVKVNVSVADANKLLGLAIKAEDIKTVLTRALHRFTEVNEVFEVIAPPERLDLRIKEDLIEEIGRHIGYDKIASVLPKLANKGLPNKRMYYANIVRNYLAQEGFSEVYTYSFATKENGECEVLHPVGKDRPFVRNQLATGLFQSLLLNSYNAPLIGIDDVRIFELGNIFPKDGEYMMLGLAVSSGDKKRAKLLGEEFERISTGLLALLDAKGTFTQKEFAPTGVVKFAPIIAEIDFDSLIQALPEPRSYEHLTSEKESVRYQSLSTYPFIVRDIAIFVPQEVTEDYIETLLKKEAGSLVVRFSQFDKFHKEGESRVSYGYRMVFQSFEKTLTDDEVNAVMDGVTAKCNAEKDWQVR